MSAWLIIVAVLLFIVGSIYWLYKSARKFKLSDEQLNAIKLRNKQLDKEEQENK